MTLIKHNVSCYDHKVGLGVGWSAMPSDSVGDSAGGVYATMDRGVSVIGNFGKGASVILEGSRDDQEWFPCLIPALTAPGIFEPMGPASQPKFLRPRVIGGDENTSIYVSAFLATEEASALR